MSKLRWLKTAVPKYLTMIIPTMILATSLGQQARAEEGANEAAEDPAVWSGRPGATEPEQTPAGWEAQSENATSIGPADNSPRVHWRPLSVEEARRQNEAAKQPARVRFGLRLTAFQKVVTRGTAGTSQTRYVPLEPLRHTLRARLNQTNHFFIGDWHVETVPTSWIHQTRKYAMKIKVYRRFGAFGQLEEEVGSVDLAGVLEPQPGNIHLLRGVARQRLRDKFGNPFLDVVAGFAPGSEVPVAQQGAQANILPSVSGGPPGQRDPSQPAKVGEADPARDGGEHSSERF